MSFLAGGSWWAVDAHHVVEVVGALTVQPVRSMHPAVLGLVPWRSRAICAVDAREWRGEAQTTPVKRMIILRCGEALFALAAEAVREVCDREDNMTCLDVESLVADLVSRPSAGPD